MDIIHSPQQITEFSREARRAGKTIAFTPTMGAFHQGHLSLMRMARQRADISITSIFVNPIQFGPGEDFDKYPRNLDQDAAMAGEEGVNIIFAPSPAQMYPAGFKSKVQVDGLTDCLCGESRPGHFDGVTTVVAKLFNIVKPDMAIFGRKDFQQLAVISKMVRDLNFDIEIIGHPIVREPDGLAMSSRNSYLSSKERRSALALFKCIQHASQYAKKGSTSVEQLIGQCEEILNSHERVIIDYISVVDRLTLKKQTEINRDSAFLLAAKVGKTRLIDNTILLDDN